MATNSCLLILILELVFYLTTVASSPLIDILVFRPIADEVRNEVGKLDFPNDTKVALLNQYINVGNYSKDFIKLLNTYKTFKNPPINFNDDEIRLLTTSNTQDSLYDKILAQLKYYRKGQEIQCAQYVTLHYKLYFDTKRNTKDISEHVYNMIAMAYKGKFIVFKWLWELYISLWSPTTDNAVQPLNMIADDLEKFRRPLSHLEGLCVQHKYIPVIDSSASRPKQIEEVIKMITEEVNTILASLLESTNKIELADLSDINTPSSRSDFLDEIEKQLTEIGRQFNGMLDGLTFDVLLFFINGSKNTQLAVFPEN
ncbi:uncharacterized protein LOC126844082 [Adelges cooleyi]|uniref:uncharacterized protein LOC126844082 n=1 Tax=Adelges cooleyi TaxID=133065 RepID=UPI0021806D3E|nr:uncharacterized protein LOC126844082 [Adelges cooleyi]